MQSSKYYFPQQSQPHQATWLQWPHSHQYGVKYEQSLEKIWWEMTKILSEVEIVRIIVYDQQHLEHVRQILGDIENVQFFVWKTDDVWVRDNGPIFARERNTGELVVQNWGFNAWGGKAQYKNCEKIPALIANTLGFKLVDLRNQMVNQGGSVQTDGQGTMLVCQSSTLNNNRNYGLKKQDAEYLFSEYYGVTNIIWLKGVPNQDITDCHIDGFAKFLNHQNLFCLNKQDLQYWGLSNQDIDKLHSSKNAWGKPYNLIFMPLTQKQLTQQQSKQKVKGSYLNFYIANGLLLVPQYNDPNDKIAIQILRSVYGNSRRIAGVEVGKLFAKGGMIHCVTQQQPVR